MKNTIKSIIALILVLSTYSCNNDFLNDNLNIKKQLTGDSNIYISSDWEKTSYQFMLPGVTNQEYEITSKPSWLHIDNTKGKIIDGVATIQCWASKINLTQDYGIFLDFMTVKSQSISYKVPVAYLKEGDPVIRVNDNLTIAQYDNNNITLNISNQGDGLLLWEIIEMPDWLKLDTEAISFDNIIIESYYSYDIPFKLNIDKLITQDLNGKITIRSNDKNKPLLTINVSMIAGDPSLGINFSSINFKIGEMIQTETIENYGNGYLMWEFENIPKWLTISPSKGICNPYSYSGDITFTCDASKLTEGVNSAIIKLKTNDKDKQLYNISVSIVMPGNNKNKIFIEGSIVDMVFDRTNDIIYYATSKPNKLIALDINSKEVVKDILLSRAPTGLAINENYSNAAVAHNGYISAIDIATNTITTTYTIDYSVYDIAWAHDNTYCFTQNGGSLTNLHWIDMANGAIVDSPKKDLDGAAIIKKIPGENYIIATRKQTSPSGFYVFDIATKQLKSYSHQALTNFWFSSDSKYLFSENANVYRTSNIMDGNDTFNQELNAIDRIDFENYPKLLDVHHRNNNLWVIRRNGNSYNEEREIYKVENTDYSIVDMIAYDALYQTDENTAPFYIIAEYIVVNSGETEMTVICRGRDVDNWVIQYIPISK